MSSSQAQIVAKRALDRLLGRKDQKDGEYTSPQASLGGDEELPFFGQPRPRSHSVPMGGLSGISFTGARPKLLPTVTRNSNGGSGSIQSPRGNRTFVLVGMATVLFAAVLYLFVLLSRPLHSFQEDPVEPPSEPSAEPVLTVADILMRSRKANATGSVPLDEKAPRVALCFFGLTRSLKFTIGSIESNILQPLRDAGYRPTVFLHTYNDADVDEQSRQTQSDEWRLLNPFQYILTSQDEFMDTHRSEMDACWMRGTGWVAAAPATQQKNLRNLLCQLNSLKEVGNLWQQQFEANPNEYKAVAFMRPDVLYRDPFPTHLLPKLKENEVYVPAWGSYSGINDRLALLRPSGAVAWKGRVDYTFEQCLEEPIHAEVFTQHFAASSGFKVKKLSEFVFFRVRSDGSIAPGDYLLPGLNTTKLQNTKAPIRRPKA